MRVRDLYQDAFIRRQREASQETSIQSEFSKDANGSNTTQHAEACCIPAGLPIVKGMWGFCQGNDRRVMDDSDVDGEVGHGSAENRHITNNAVEGVNSDVQSNHARTDDNGDGTSVQQREEVEMRVERSAKKWCDRVRKVDQKGKTILHHAAESASLDIFALVFKMAGEDGVKAHKRMAMPDMGERTPTMLFLRNKCGSCDDSESDATNKMRMLCPDAPEEGWMRQRMVPPVWKLTGNNQAEENGKEFITLARTELLHAARGGPTMLDLTLKCLKKQPMMTTNSNEVDLDKVLGMEICSTIAPREEGQQGLHHEFRQFLKTTAGEKRLARPRRAAPASEEELRSTMRHWGYGMLLAAAVKGGHERVIKRVVSAIEVNPNKKA